MKALFKLQKNTQRIIVLITVFIALGIAANAQTRSYTLSVLQKTDYVINEAYDITDYFYFDDGEFIAKAVHFQDYAYYLYDSRRYNQAVQYSLMSRSYAINAIEICDEYWHYYDYHYYGYSPMWGQNTGFSVSIGNTQLHWGLTNAIYHSNIRVNWDLYFTTREWRYYRGLPVETVLLNGLYQHRGGVVYFNDRFSNHNIYTNMRTRINSGRDIFVKSYPNTTPNMAPKPKAIKPSNAPAPTRTRRETVNANNGQQNITPTRNSSNSNVSGSRSSSSLNDRRRPASSSNIGSKDVNSATGTSSTSPTTSRRPASSTSGTNTGSVNTGNNSRRQTTAGNARTTAGSSNVSKPVQSSRRRTSQIDVNNRSNSAQDRQARKQTQRSTETTSKTTNASSSRRR